MRRFSETLFGDEALIPYEQRIFHMVALVGIVLTIFGTVMNIVTQVVSWVDFAFIGAWVITYYVSRFTTRYRVVSMVGIVLFVFAFLPYQWISSGGSNGLIPCYVVLFASVVSTILHGMRRTAMMLSILLIVPLLILYDWSIGSVNEGALLLNGIHIEVILTAAMLLAGFNSDTYRAERTRREAYEKTIKEQIRQQTYYMENLEQLINKLKAERHDFNHHLGMIHGMLLSGEMDKVKDYTLKMVSEAAEYQTIVNIPYSALRALLNHKLSAARESGIELRLDVRLLEGLAINEFDLAMILGNLLDNAKEACLRMADADRYIAVTIKYQPQYLVVCVSNPVPEAPRKSVKTTKPDRADHGFGLDNVEFLVKKHNGLMNIKSEKGVFEVDIALLVD